MTRLKTINRLLTLFPKPENTELSEGAQIDILINMCPSSWIIEMAKSKFDPAEHSLDDVKFECERHEIMGEIEQANKKVFEKCTRKGQAATRRRTRRINLLRKRRSLTNLKVKIERSMGATLNLHAILQVFWRERRKPLYGELL